MIIIKAFTKIMSKIDGPLRFLNKLCDMASMNINMYGMKQM